MAEEGIILRVDRNCIFGSGQSRDSPFSLIELVLCVSEQKNLLIDSGPLNR